MSGFLTKVNDNSSVIDCALDSGALFDPKRIHTLLPNGTSCDKTFTVYRELEDGSQAVLNAGVTKQYLASSYQLLFDTAEEMLPNSCNQFSLFGNGERVCAERSDEQQLIALGQLDDSLVFLRLTVTNDDLVGLFHICELLLRLVETVNQHLIFLLQHGQR